MKLIIEFFAIYVSIRGIIRRIIPFFTKENSFQLYQIIMSTILSSLLFLFIIEFLNYQYILNYIVPLSIAIIIVLGLNYLFKGNKHYLELYKDKEFENGSYLNYYLVEFDKYVSKISLSLILVNELINQLKILRH